MPVHISVGGEGVPAVLAMEGAFSAVHQDVTIQAAIRAQNFLAYPAGVALLGVLHLVFVVVRPDVERELVLGRQDPVADGTDVFSLGRRAVASIVGIGVFGEVGLVDGGVGG